MTNREKLNDLSSNIKNLNNEFLKLDELITYDGFGDMNELQEYQNMPARIHQASLNYHSFFCCENCP